MMFNRLRHSFRGSALPSEPGPTGGGAAQAAGRQAEPGQRGFAGAIIPKPNFHRQLCRKDGIRFQTMPKTMKRFKVFTLSCLVLFACVVGSCWLLEYHDTVLKRKSARLETGMTRLEVEAIMGEGNRLPVNEVPRLGNRPAVFGDEFYTWSDQRGTVYVGFEHGRLVSKWYWEPSL